MNLILIILTLSLMTFDFYLDLGDLVTSYVATADT